MFNFRKSIKRIQIEGYKKSEIIKNKEIQQLRILKPENIINYFEDFTDKTYLYIVFEFYESIDLQSYLDANGRLERIICLNWFRQIVSGLKYSLNFLFVSFIITF